MTGPRIVSHGGGVQTTAMLVLAARGVIDYQTFVFANVGNNAEDPGTLRYLSEIARPYAAKHGIEIIEVQRRRRNGTPYDLYDELTREGSRSVEIPARMEGGAAPGNRGCTGAYKIAVIGEWLKRNGATEENKATVAIGISSNEVTRVNSRKIRPYEILAYPLIGITDGKRDPNGLWMRRDDCETVIRDEGLPLPPRSACWFCPLKSPGEWASQRHDDPELFEKSRLLELTLIRRRETLGKDPVYLTRYGAERGLTIDKVFPAGQSTIGDISDDNAADYACDSGSCFT